MLVRKLLAWAAEAPPNERAPAAAALARALMDRTLLPVEQDEAEMALTVLADDSSPLVRRALAAELAPRADAPRHILLTLAHDQTDVAEPILRQSGALSPAELIDCARMGGAPAHMAIASRADTPPAVCAALADACGREAALSLLANAGAHCDGATLGRLTERFCDDVEVREALLAREDLPPASRAALVDATASALRALVMERGWMSGERVERAVREASDQGVVAVPRDGQDEALALVRSLRGRGRLTPALLLRGILSGDQMLLAAALAELGGVDFARAQGYVAAPEGPGFAALCARAELPEALVEVFRAAALAARRWRNESDVIEGGRLIREIVDPVLAAAEKAAPGPAGDGAPVVALLRRLQSEAIRREARNFQHKVREIPLTVDVRGRPQTAESVLQRRIASLFRAPRAA